MLDVIFVVLFLVYFFVFLYVCVVVDDFVYVNVNVVEVENVYRGGVVSDDCIVYILWFSN